MLFPKFDQMKNRRDFNHCDIDIQDVERFFQETANAQLISVCKIWKKWWISLGKIEMCTFFMYAKEFLEFYVLTLCYTVTLIFWRKKFLFALYEWKYAQINFSNYLAYNLRDLEFEFFHTLCRKKWRELCSFSIFFPFVSIFWFL